MIKILIVDDHAVVRAGIRHFIDAVPAMEITGEAATAEAAMRLVRGQEFDVVLLDIAMRNTGTVEKRNS